MGEGEAGPALSSDPRARALQLEALKARERDAGRKAAAEAEKAVADAEKAQAEVGKMARDAVTSQFPSSTSKGPEGKVETDEKFGLVSDLVAHALLADAGSRIARELKPLLSGDEEEGDPQSRLLIVESADLLSSDWPFAAVTTAIESTGAAMTQIVGELEPLVEVSAEAALDEFALEELQPDLDLLAASAVPPLSVVPGLVGTAVDVASLFRADYKVTSKEVEIGSPPLVASLAAHLIPLAKEVNVDGFGLLDGSLTFASFAFAQRQRMVLGRLCAEAKETRVAPADRSLEEIKELRAKLLEGMLGKDAGAERIAELKARLAGLEESAGADVAEVGRTRALVAAGEAAIERFKQLEADLTKVPETGYPPLVAAAIRERLHSSNSYSHVLFASLEASGGESTTRRTFLGTKVRFMGGAHVSYLLWDVAEKRLVAANAFPVLGEVRRRLGFFGTGDYIDRIGLG